MHIGQFVLSWTANLSFSRDEQIPFGTWLAEIGLGRYDAIFASNKIDFDVIRPLTDADLRELGLTLGDRKRLLQAVARLDEQRAEILSPRWSHRRPLWDRTTRMRFRTVANAASSP